MTLRTTSSYWILALTSPLLAGDVQAQAKLSAAHDVTAEFALPEGLAVTQWAETPQVYNPTAMDVDAQGRVWVTEAVNYRQWQGRNPGLHRPEGDRVVILEDTDGDGVCDSSKVFVQEKDLVAPLGIAVLGDKVIVSCSPMAIVYTDADGDDKPDQREVFLTGFGGHDHDHGLHSFVAGPDGRFYFNTGNAGPHIVTDRSGWTLRSGSLYRGGGEFETDNAPRMVSDDGRIWTGGLVLRIDPDGQHMAVLAHNFRNNYEVALDSFGNLWQSDNDDDGNASCRTLFVMEGGNHGYFSADGSRYWNADRRPGQSIQTAHWHQDDPGVIPAGTINGAGGPTGVAVYEGDLCGSRCDGMILNADAGRNCVYGHIPHARGAGFELERTIFLAPTTATAPPSANGQSGEPTDAAAKNSRWFRPSDVAVGTDGSVFVADWWDPGVGGHAAGDAQAYGRILRIAPRGSKVARPAYDSTTIEGALAMLASPAVDVRWQGFRALQAERERALPAIVRALASTNDRQRARALWLAASSGDSGAKVAEVYLGDPNPDLRLVAFRALRSRPGDLLRLARARADDPSPAVRREVAIALRDVPYGACRDILLTLARGFDGSDRWYLEALGIGAQGKEDALYADLAAAQNPDPSKWSAAFAAIAWRLHVKSAVPALALRAGSAALTPAARTQAVDALAFVRERAAAEAMVNLALAGPEDVRPRAAWWVENRDSNDWSAYTLAAQVGLGERQDAKLVYSSGAVTHGSVEVDADIRGARTLWLVVNPGKNGNACDWSDWIEPRLVTAAGETKLVELPWVRAGAAWGAVGIGQNANGGKLAIGGRVFADGIGTHAASEIVYALPAQDYTRFKATAGIDDGGSGQPGAKPQVEFQVFVDAPHDASRVRALEHVLTDSSAPEAERLAAVETLAADREGGLALIHLAQKKELDGRVTEAAARVIFKNPDPAVRALATQYFPRQTTAGAPLPPVAKLLAMHGDAKHGAEVFFSPAALCSSCHTYRGRGADVGPDLSEVRKKYGQAEILDAILNPSAAIAFGFDTWLIETTEGQLLSGFILADGENVLLKDTSGKRSVIAAADIAARTKQKLSTMPDNVGLGLSPQDLADVVALLSADPDAQPVFGSPIALFDGTDLNGWTFYLEDANAKMSDVWSVEGGILTCKGRPIGYLRTEADYEDFQLEVEWRFPPGAKPGNSGVLLRMTGPDKVWPKSIEAQLEHRNAGDIWNIDAVDMDVERSRTSGRHTAKEFPSNEKPLGEWNKYVITLSGGDLTLAVNGLVQNRARWCARVPGKICLQSEGAPIQFRNIVLRPIRTGGAR
jgi:putative membrane-bound dehydrogenase-like protein